LLRILTWVEEFLYRRANAIVCATAGLVDDIIARGIPDWKIVKIMNGVDTDRFHPDIDGGSVRRSLRLDGKKVVVYTGIFGRAHGLSVLLDAASILREHEEIVFVLVGDGADKENLVELQRQEDLRNVLFISPQPHERMAEFIVCADVCFASLREGEFTKRSIPAKMFEYMACARPVILCGSGEAAALIQAADAGICVEAGDPVSLADSILKICDNPGTQQRYGRNGRSFVRRYLSRKELAKEFERVLHPAFKKRRPPREEMIWTNK
jgi:glycosyltransferase involved in cell wall biosynthesis